MTFQPPGQAAGTPAVLFQLPVLDPALEASVATLNKTNASIEMVIAGVQAFIATKPEEKNFDSLGHTLDAYKTRQPLISSWFGGFLNYDGIGDQVKLTYFQEEKKILDAVATNLSDLSLHLAGLANSGKKPPMTIAVPGGLASEDLKWFNEKIEQLVSRLRPGGPFTPAVPLALPRISTDAGAKRHSPEAFVIAVAETLSRLEDLKIQKSQGSFVSFKGQIAELSHNNSRISKPGEIVKPALGAKVDAVFQGFVKSRKVKLLLTKFLDNELHFEQQIFPGRGGANVVLPVTGAGEPIFLLDRLFDEDPIKLDTATQLGKELGAKRELGENIRLMVGVSGCGKTRRCFELLCAYYGFFFIADVKRSILMQELQYSTDIADAIQYSSDNCSGVDLARNQSYAEHFMRVCILARLLVLNWCLDKTREKLGRDNTDWLSAFPPRKWLLLQIGARHFADGMDLFATLSYRLAHCAFGEVRNEIARVTNEVVDKLQCDQLRCDQLFIVLDEYQALSECGKEMYPSQTAVRDTEEKFNASAERRALLSPFITALCHPYEPGSQLCESGSQSHEPRSSPFNMIVCGTHVSALRDMSCIISSYGKLIPAPVIALCGGWKTPEQVEEYAGRFYGMDEVACKKLFEVFRGRYRFLVTCLSQYLLDLARDQGNTLETLESAMKRVWNKVVNDPSASSMANRVGQVIDYLMKKPGGYLDNFLWQSTKFFYLGLPSEYDSVYSLLVENGIANYFAKEGRDGEYIHSSVDSLPSIRVKEPVAIAAVFTLLKSSGRFKRMLFNAISRSSTASGRGDGFEFAVAAFFEDVFERGGRFTAATLSAQGFQTYNITEDHEFHEYPPSLVVPEFSAGMRLRRHLKKSYNMVDFLIDVSPRRPVFFKPDNNSGPDQVFFLRFGGEEFIVLVQDRTLAEYTQKDSNSAVSSIAFSKFKERVEYFCQSAKYGYLKSNINAGLSTEQIQSKERYQILAETINGERPIVNIVVGYVVGSGDGPLSDSELDAHYNNTMASFDGIYGVCDKTRQGATLSVQALVGYIGNRIFDEDYRALARVLIRHQKSQMELGDPERSSSVTGTGDEEEASTESEDSE